MKMSKKEIYANYGIEYQNGKIKAPVYGFINPLLVNGNEKLGKGVWTFSLLPTNKIFDLEIDGQKTCVPGTCPCHCTGCYATKGNYNFSSVKISLAKKTILCYQNLDFVERAIMAQIEADNIEILRIHASGDFFSLAYINMWKRIITHYKNVLFWTYTKYNKAENAFNNIENINVVPSIIMGCGYNFGHIDYIIETYYKLKQAGKTVYICRCGIDNNQHCTNCRGCTKNEYVLFVEHSTEYKAEKDPLYNTIKEIIENQQSMEEEV